MAADDIEIVVCPFCHESGEPTLGEDGWTARQCGRCRLVFLSPRPTAEAVARLYASDASHSPAHSHMTRFNAPLARLEARRVIQLLGTLTAPGRFLEIGPGGGSVLHAARAAGWAVGAVEPNPEQAAFISDVLGIPCWRALTEVQGHWDVVYHRDVLSHFHDPVEVFATIRGLVRPGGYHVFETGNGDFDRRYDPLFPTFQFPDHLFFFSAPSLALLLEQSGFALVTMRAYSLVPQLAMERAIRRLFRRGQARAIPAVAQPGSLAGPGHPRGRSQLRTAARVAWAAARFAARYGLGSIAPKRHRPQHVLVVARPR